MSRQISYKADQGQVAPLQAKIELVKTTRATVQNEARYDPRLAGLAREADALMQEARTLLRTVQDRATDTRQHRSEMGQAEKVQYINKHGSEAFMDLPA